MPTLSAVNETLMKNNDTLDNVSKTLSDMLAEEVKRRKEESRGRKDAEEAAREAARRGKTTKVSTGGRQPTTTAGEFGQGLFGDKLYAMATGAIAGLFSGIGGVSLAKLAGRGVKFGAAGLALTSLAQEAVDRLFDNVDPAKLEELGIQDPEEFKKKATTAISTGFALKFLGAKGPAAIAGGIGAAFGGDIANVLSGWLGDNIINKPNPLKSLFGIGPDTIGESLDNENVQIALGASVAIIASKLLKFVGLGLGRMLVVGGVAGAIALFKKLGMTSVSDVLEKARNAGAKTATDRGFDPKNTDGPKVKPPVAPKITMPTSPTAPLMPNVDPALKGKPIALSDAVKNVLKEVQAGSRVVPGLQMVGEGANARPQIIDEKTKRLRFASNKEVTKLINEAADESSRLAKALGSVSTTAKLAANTAGKALVPVAFALDTYTGITDQEMKDAGVNVIARVNGAIAESTLGFFDLMANVTGDAVDYFTGRDDFGRADMAGALRAKRLENAKHFQEMQDLSSPVATTVVQIDASTNSSDTTSVSNRHAGSDGSYGMSAIDKRTLKQQMIKSQGFY